MLSGVYVQTIYAWRLADVRRILGLAARLEGLRRVALETNYRCPKPVVSRAVRLVEHNHERFAKRVRARPDATGDLVLAPDPGDDVARARQLLRAWLPRPQATRTPAVPARAILARTNVELLPYAAVALELGISCETSHDERAAGGLLLDHPALDRLIEDASAIVSRQPDAPLLLVLDAAREAAPRELDELSGALLAWAAPYRAFATLRAAIERARAFHRAWPAAAGDVTLATVHGSKGLEFDEVCCIALDEGRFPSRRAIEEATDPDRALEEERRLAYVAWTRARRCLLLQYDPAMPSVFLREAFAPDELAAPAAGRLAATAPAATVPS